MEQAPLHELGIDFMEPVDFPGLECLGYRIAVFAGGSLHEFSSLSRRS